MLKRRIPGGRAYGYDVVAPDSQERKAEHGERWINPQQAAIVVRIFESFADGMSPRAIAKRLNAEAVPGPDCRQWRDTTIRGQVDRGTGLLNNQIYIGKLVWNRTSYVKNPRTGRRVARINPPEMHESVEIPDLRIVSDDLWNRVKIRQEAMRIAIGRDDDGNALNRVHRRKFMFRGLLVCGECGRRSRTVCTTRP